MVTWTVAQAMAQQPSTASASAPTAAAHSPKGRRHMTRAEMVTLMVEFADHSAAGSIVEWTPTPDCCADIAAELAKNCAGCKNGQHIPAVTQQGGDTGVSTPAFTLCTVWEIATPADGSGFCHRWEAK